MGDVKLLAALGVWLGPLTILIVFGASAVIGAVMAAAVMVGGMFTRGISATRRRYSFACSGGRNSSCQSRLSSLAWATPPVGLDADGAAAR